MIDFRLFQDAETAGAGAWEGRPEITCHTATLRKLTATPVHIDHVGRIPYLLAAVFKARICCSEVPAQLLHLVLEDALKAGFTKDKALIISRVIT